MNHENHSFRMPFFLICISRNRLGAKSILLIAIALQLFFTQVNFAEEKPTQAGFHCANQLQEKGFKPLFTGEDISSWEIKPGHRNHWTVKQGVFDYDGKATVKKHLDRSLWTKKSFGDTILYVEWRLPDTPVMKPHPIVLWNGDFLRDETGKRITRPHLDAGDSGILFRGIMNCQANIWSQELGSGEINGYRTNRKLPQLLRRSCIPLVFGDNPLGQWNAFLITMQSSRMKVVLNGQEVLHSQPLPDLPAKGPIGLQHHGDHVQFRQIWVKEIQADE